MSDIDYDRTAKELFAGGVAGTAGIIVGLPFDLVKVRVQVQPGKYKSGMDCFLRSVKKDGFMSLYRGMMAPVLSQMPINAVLFAAEEAASRFMEPGVKKDKQTFFTQYIAGAVAGLVQCIVLVPFDRVKCLVQADGLLSFSNEIGKGKRKYTGTLDCARQIVKIEGFQGFFKGFGATAVREVPSLGIYFTVYKNVSTFFNQRKSKWFPEAAGTVIAGGCAGATSWVVVYPIDVVKTTIQTKHPDKSVLQVSKIIYKSYGVNAFFRGMGTTVTRAFPVNGITFLGYEKLKVYFGL
jgi:solute carrier family 25 (mitochondrial carnitine/acylcarnitine transporter), member 20/29